MTYSSETAIHDRHHDHDDDLIHLLSATSAHIPSIIPKGHAPCKNPYIEPKAQANEKPKINQ